MLVNQIVGHNVLYVMVLVPRFYAIPVA
jgi:hypothetical protein